MTRTPSGRAKRELENLTQHARTPPICATARSHRNSLHFAFSHAGEPDIDPDKHRLVIHGLVKQPLVFTLDVLARYPMVSRMALSSAAAQRAVIFPGADSGQCAGFAWPRLLHRMDWSAALHFARRGRYRSEGRVDPAEGADPPHLSCSGRSTNRWMMP
jgi:sulfane dehydrogenase subunit SoxC